MLSPLSPACDARLSAWCEQYCPHSVKHKLFARLDTDSRNGLHQWRCYARETLSEDLTRYISGDLYCTRDRQLQEQLKLQCDNPLRVAVGADGQHFGAGSSSSDGDDDDDEALSMNATNVHVHDERVTTLDLVVAHCRESLGWLADAQQALRRGFEHNSPPEMRLAISLHLREKCLGGPNSSSDDAADYNRLHTGWARETRTFLENKGEECLGYLTFLVEHYRTLSEYVIFLQGDGENVRSLEGKFAAFAERVVAPRATDVWLSVTDHQYIGIGRTEEACAVAAVEAPIGLDSRERWVGLVESNCRADELSHLRRCMDAFHRRHWAAPLPDVVTVYTNAQAGLSRDRILARPRSFYRGLLAEFERRPEDECYRTLGKRANGAAEAEQAGLMARPFRGTCAMLEYLWPMIFGEASLLDPTHAMSGGFLRGGIRPGVKIDFAR